MNPEVRVSPDPELLAEDAAELLIASYNDAVNKSGRFMLAISGGSTPLSLFRLLATGEYSTRLDWSRVHIFWADERCVPPDSRDSNYNNANETLLSRVLIPAGNIHRIRTELPLDEAARVYEADIRSAFGSDGMPSFDLILLGMGADGHTASLFPGSDVLKVTDRLAVPVHPDIPGIDRVTLTLPVINSAKQVTFMVTGTDKAAVIHSVLSGEGDRYPASQVKPSSGRLVWLLDAAAS